MVDSGAPPTTPANADTLPAPADPLELLERAKRHERLLMNLHDHLNERLAKVEGRAADESPISRAEREILARLEHIEQTTADLVLGKQAEHEARARRDSRHDLERQRTQALLRLLVILTPLLTALASWVASHDAKGPPSVAPAAPSFTVDGGAR